MKKWIAILLTLTMVLGLFAACGSTTQPAASTAVSDPEPAEASAVVEAPPAPAAEPIEETSAEDVPLEPIVEEPAEIVHLIEFPIDESFTITVSESTTPSLTGSSLIGDDGSELGWAKWLHARTGADIQVDLYSFLDATDKQNLMIASGDYTDILVGSLNYSGGVDGAVEEEVLTNIAEYAEYMPDYMNTLFQNINNVARGIFYGLQSDRFLRHQRCQR